MDTVDAIRAMRDGRASVFMGMGGNFAMATPDTAVTEAALRSCSLTVQVSTKLNRSHLSTAPRRSSCRRWAAPTRTCSPGAKQQVSVEDSMSMVHLSRGSLQPPGEHVRSEVAIVSQLARAVLGADHPVPWEAFQADYDRIRDAIAAVVPGCEDYNRKVRQPDGFQLPHPPRDSREFHTTTGKANFAVNPLEWIPVPEGRLILQTLRSHDQYNTTIYGLDDRYRGVKGGRRVVFVNPADIAVARLRPTATASTWSPNSPTAAGDVEERRAEDFMIVGVLHPGRQRSRLLPRDQLAGGAGPRGRPLQHAGLQGRQIRLEAVGPMGRVTARRRASHLTADGATARPETLAVEEPHGDPRQRHGDHRDDAHPRRPTSNWRKAFCSPRA